MQNYLLEIEKDPRMAQLHQKNSRAETSDLSLRRSSANTGYIS